MSAEAEVYKEGVIRTGLSLKGKKLLMAKGGSSRKKRKLRLESSASSSMQQAEAEEVAEKMQQEEKEEETNNDERTEAEKSFDFVREKRGRHRAKERLKMTHRQRIDKFNEHLSRLSEHFDLPKVGG